MERKPGIITDDTTFCIVCGRMKTADHHLLIGSYRKLADQDGLYIPICDDCHTLGAGAIHRSSAAILGWKIAGQLAWENKKMAAGMSADEAREAFMKRYERSWI